MDEFRLKVIEAELEGGGVIDFCYFLELLLDVLHEFDGVFVFGVGVLIKFVIVLCEAEVIFFFLELEYAFMLEFSRRVFDYDERKCCFVQYGCILLVDLIELSRLWYTFYGFSSKVISMDR